MAGSSPNVNQPVFPLVTAPFVEPSGHLTVPWFRFLVNLWNRTGGSNAPVTSAVYFVQAALGSLLAYLVQASGQVLLGTVLTTQSNGPTAQVLNPISSPMNFTASVAGTFIANSGTILLSRGGNLLGQIGVVGGCVPLMAGDGVQLQFNSPPSLVLWLPSS